MLSKIKMLFSQHIHNLSDPELEDQVNDRLSFQKFAGIDYTKAYAEPSSLLSCSNKTCFFNKKHLKNINFAASAMAILKLSIDDILCDDTPVFIAINSSLKMYRLAYKLNEILKIHLKKNSSLEKQSLGYGFDTYSWVDTFGVVWELISNRFEIPDENASLGLFKDLKKVIYLTQDKIDCILKIKDDSSTIDENAVISKINQLSLVTIAQKYQPKDKNIIYKLIH